VSVYADVRAALGLDEARPSAPRGTRPARSHAPRHAPRVPFAVLVVTLIAGGLGLLLLLNTASAANEVHHHDLAARDAGVAAQVQELQNEVAASAAPANLAAAAGELGMVPAGNPAFLVVGPDGSVRVMGRPARVSGAAVAAIPPKKSATHTATHTATKSASKSASKTETPTGKPKSSSSTSPKAGAGTSRTATHAGPTRSEPNPSPTPTPTPTPTVVLPGGDR